MARPLGVGSTSPGRPWPGGVGSTSLGRPWPAGRGEHLSRTPLASLTVPLQKRVFFLHLVSRGTWVLGSGHDPGPLLPRVSRHPRVGLGLTAQRRVLTGPRRGWAWAPLRLPALGLGACDPDTGLRAAAELSLRGPRARRAPPERAQPSPLPCRRLRRACHRTRSRRAGRRPEQAGLLRSTRAGGPVTPLCSHSKASSATRPE